MVKVSNRGGQSKQAVGLDRPGQAYLIFDHSRRIIHASTDIASVLRLADRLLLPGDNVTQLLEAAVGIMQMTSSIEPWLNGQLCSLKASTVNLVTATDARTVQAVLSPIGDQYCIAVFEDVTTSLDGKNEIWASAYRDSLTGIGNRLLFEHNLDTAMSRLTAGYVDNFIVLFLDLDRFKVVNDTLGHAVGDSLLRLVCGRLQSCLRDSDSLARLGGDEFAILLTNSPGKEVAIALAKQVIDLVQRPYLIEGQVVNVGASIGISVAPTDGTSRDQLLKGADMALYHSKAAGRGIFHFFVPAMEEKVQRRRALEKDLRKALVLRQFELHYQPQINVDNQTVIGLEGLLRWRHPQRGLLLPSDFFWLIDEIGLAVPIGEWVLKTACLEAKRWPDSMTLAVNISPLQFEMGTFAASVERALVAVDLPGYRLEVEVTEDILLRDSKTVRATLDALRTLGVKVAMDSFGTGVASLSQLVNFPFDTIKIDRSLMDMNHDEAKHRAIVRAVCALSQSLGISTLAEGVETAEQLADVRSEGCDSVQGFYYSKAVPANELSGLFSSLLSSLGTPECASKEAA